MLSFAIRKLSVIVPCFNEEGNIARYPTELILPFSVLGPDVEFVFVDDGSTDTTPIQLRELCLQQSRCQFIQHLQNKGLGASVRTGLERCTGDAVVTLDADLTFHPREAKKLLMALADNVDAVLGSPWLGAMTGVSFIRRAMSQTVNAIYRYLLGKPITATSSLFRIYRASAIKSLTLTSSGFNINAEIVIRLLQNKKNIIEVPVVLTSRVHGESKISFVREIQNHLKLFFWLIQLRIRKTL